MKPFFLLFSLLLAGAPLLGSLRAAQATLPPASVQMSPASRFGQLPLFFEANRGQADPAALFVARGRAHSLYLMRDGALLDLAREGEGQGNALRPQGGKGSRPALDCTLRLTFLGVNKESRVTGLESLPGQINYLIGANASAWQPGIPTFARVRCEALYPGVDLIYYGNNGWLEFDFVLAPGAAPSQIAWRIDGANRLEIEGDLILRVGDRQLRQHRPIAYQIINGQRRGVPVRYELRDHRTVGFVLGHYDTRYPLTIDPILSYSTYIGGSKGDTGWAIAVDGAGSAYIAGDTLSLFKKLPLSGFQTNFNGGTRYGGDAFVAKLDPTGTNLLFLTYLGGSGLDGAVGLALDGAGNAFLTGYTDSTNFPTAGAATNLQPAIAGTNDATFDVHAPDAFVAKLDASGADLIYSTYLGGEGNDTGTGIAVDVSGAAYVVGTTESAIVFRTTNEVCTVLCTNVAGTNNICGTTSECITNVILTRLFNSTQVATNFVREQVIKSSTDPSVRYTNVITKVITTNLLGAVQVTAGFPTVNPIQTNNHGPANFFISKLTPAGDALVYSTYLGGTDEDRASGIAVDSTGRAMVCGSSSSLDFPVTNALQEVAAGLIDAVLAKLEPAGNALVYATYLGGTHNDVAYRVATDGAGAAYVAGSEGSSEFPSTPGSLNRGGLFQSTDVGGSWALRSSGLTHTVVQALLADPANPGTLYAGTPRGVFKSLNNGATWNNVSTGLINRAVLTLAYNPSNAVLFAGTLGGLFSSTNAALNWNVDGLGISSTSIRALLFEPGTNEVVYAGTSGGVFKRVYDTNSFVAINAGLKNRSVNALAQSPADLTVLYAATDGGMFKSTNSGTNWRGSSAGLKTKKSLSLALDPSNAEVLYVGTSKGLFKSTDASTNWVQMTNGIGRPSVNALLIDPGLPATVYAGTSIGLFKSIDAGTNWTASQTNLDTHLVAALIFANSSTSTLYAGTRGTNFAGGTNDAFLAKVTPDGSGFAYAFTLGGSKNDEGWDVAVDSTGVASLTGATASKNFPVAGALLSSQTNLAGRTDVFVTQVDPTGASNIFSIYLGGKGHDFGHGIAVDASGGVYVVGQTSSSGFITTNAIQPTFASGSKDAFVLKLIPSPGLLMARQGKNLILRWTPFPTPYVLESCDPLEGRWSPITQAPVLEEEQYKVVLPLSDGVRLFRLRQVR